jgi:hypothetical protein
MKRSIILFSFLLIFSTFAFAQWKHIPANKSLPAHPRLLLFAGEEESIKKSISSDTTWAKVHNIIVAECDRIASLPELKREMVGRRLLGVSREALRRIFYLSYSYRMTGKEAYLKKAERELLSIAAFSDWNPTHFLDVAEMTMTMAIGYDWLYNSLAPETRRKISDAILVKGLDQSLNSKLAWYWTGNNNWNQVCNAGICFGAIALYDEMPNLSVSLLDKAIESIKLPMKEYEPDGAYPEGYGYWEYGTSFNALFLSAIENLFGTDFGLLNNEAFFKTARYQENMTGPQHLAFNYSDSGIGGGLSPTMFWFASRMNDVSILWNEKYYLSQNIRANDRILPAIMIWGRGINLSDVKAPENRIWSGSGVNPVSLMRTSWTNKNAIFVGFKGGRASSNHAHIDAGTFIVDADGVRWASDFGMQDYNSLETKGVDLWNMKQNSGRWNVFRYNNRAHNTLTVDDKLHAVDGFADIISTSSLKNFTSTVINLSPVFKNQLAEAKRGVAIVDDKYVLVRDEIKAENRESVIRWNMLTGATAKITGKKSFELRKDGKTMTVTVVEPADIKLMTWSTKSPNDYDAENPNTVFIGFETTAKANADMNIVVTLAPKSSGKIRLSTTRLSEWPKE